MSDLDDFLIPYLEKFLRDLCPEGNLALRRQEEPLIDGKLVFNKKEILVELTGYQELGPALKAHERLQRFRTAFSDAAESDPKINRCLITFRFRRKSTRDGPGYDLPTWKNQDGTFRKMLEEVRVLASRVHPDGAREDFEFSEAAPTDRKERIRQSRSKNLFVTTQDFPTLSRHCSGISIYRGRDDVVFTLPAFNSDTKAFGLDTEELSKTITKKHEKLQSYRVEAKGRPVWLLVVSSFDANSLVISHMADEFLTIVLGICAKSTERFDAVIWVNSPTTSKPHAIICDSTSYPDLTPPIELTRDNLLKLIGT